MLINQFTLLGRVGWIDMKYSEKGVGVTTINLGVKKNKESWNNFFIKFFNTQKNELADKVMNTIREGDYVSVVGKISESKFTPQGAEKEISKIELVGWKCERVEYDELRSEYVPVSR